mgnify:CR=1 FL=1|tara:strand:+ start:471 stop:608 length:138 start_codon:yes stop_codon:yes gene_type:complete
MKYYLIYKKEVIDEFFEYEEALSMASEYTLAFGHAIEIKAVKDDK